MGLTYDGITYRSLEEQVRYDAEQVQLLKQADATINENLQTINTEINGKLTKPTNPSAESAVTLLADGTVGTKPLSEIGGGGKLYLHHISFWVINTPITCEIFLYLTSNTPLTNLNAGDYIMICKSTGDEGKGLGIISVPNSGLVKVSCILGNGSTVKSYFDVGDQINLDYFTDTRTEV